MRETAQEREFSGKRNLWKKERAPGKKKKKNTTAEEVKGWERKKEPEGYSGIVQRDRIEERKNKRKDVREGQRMRVEGRGREKTWTQTQVTRKKEQKWRKGNLGETKGREWVGGWGQEWETEWKQQRQQRKAKMWDSTQKREGKRPWPTEQISRWEGSRNKEAGGRETKRECCQCINITTL